MEVQNAGQNDDAQYPIIGIGAPIHLHPPDAPSFGDFQEAHRYAIDKLLPMMRRQAEEVGTSSTRVEDLVHDRVAPQATAG